MKRNEQEIERLVAISFRSGCLVGIILGCVFMATLVSLLKAMWR